MNYELAIKALVIIGGMYLLAKILSPFISDFLSPNKAKKNHDLDSMIKRKEEYLRVTGAAGTTQSKKASTSKQNTNEQRPDYVEIVKNEFMALSQKQHKSDLEQDQLVELKKTISLLDSLQWGQSEELTAIRRRFEKYFDFAPDEKLFLKSIRYALIHSAIIKDKNKSTGHEDLVESIILISLNEIIKNSFSQNDSSEIKTLAKRWHTSPVTIQKAWLLWIHEKGKLSSNDLIENLIKYDNPLAATDLMTLFGFGIDSLPWKNIILESGKNRKTSDVIETLKEDVSTIKAISKLSNAEELTVKVALELLGFESVPAPGILSRRYKKLARIMHPDRISSKGFPSSVMDRVNENFRTIKAAYDLLKNEQE